MPDAMQRRHWTAIVLIMFSAVIVEFSMGRRLWGVGGQPGIWSGDIWSSHNSQFIADPYSFTHVTHGILFYALSTLVFGSASFASRLVGTVALESAWEVLENTSWVIERYRLETISLNYFGDSIVNSMSDVLACMLGFYLASRLPTRVSAYGVIALEILLLIWTRDNLAINIVMLLHPSPTIQAWQLGK